VAILLFFRSFLVRHFYLLNFAIRLLYALLKNVLWGTPEAGGRRPQGFRSLSKRVFIRSLSNLVNMLVGIISRPSSITCQIYPDTPELWPLNCPKTELAVSALQVENPAHKHVVITIEFTTNTYFVSVWHSCLFYFTMPDL